MCVQFFALFILSINESLIASTYDFADFSLSATMFIIREHQSKLTKATLLSNQEYIQYVYNI